MAVEEVISRSQGAQTQSRGARKRPALNLSERLALSPREFGLTIGRSATKVYRDIYAGKIKVIADAGRMMIPRTEIDRFLAKAAKYDPKPKSRPASEDGGQP
jgi:hypothetical protein